MRKSVFSVITLAALTLGVGPAAAADESDAQERFERRVRQINDIADKPATLKQAFHHISVETGVSEEQVQRQHKRHPDLKAAGLLLANVMSAETRKEPEQFIKQRASGKKWLAIARQNNVPIENLNTRLDNLEKAIAPGAEEHKEKRKK